MKHLLLIVSFMYTITSSAQTGILSDQECLKTIRNGLDKAYNFEFREAEKIYREVKMKYPNHPAYDYLISHMMYWEILYEDSFKEKSAEYLVYLERTLEKAEAMLAKNKNDLEGTFFSLAATSSLSLYYSERGDNLKTITSAKKAYSFMKEGFVLKDKFIEFYFTTGLYNYYVVQYPETHPSYKPFMFFFTSGNKIKGLEQLNHAANNCTYTNIEAIYYLSNIFLKYENDNQKAYEYSKRLADKYPNNFYFVSRYIESLINTGRYKEAEILSYKLFKTGKKYFMYVSYVFYGMLHEKHFHDPETARKYYLQAVNLSKELSNPSTDYLSMAYTGLGRIHHQWAQTDKAIAYYKSAKKIAEYAWVIKETEAYLDKYD